MRIDKFLKNSRLIKRRTVAHQACEGGRVKINSKTAKPSSDVNIGDIIEISFGSNSTKLEVLAVTEHLTKEDSKEMYKLI